MHSVTFGSGSMMSYLKGGGTFRPPRSPLTVQEDQYFHMNGAEIMQFTAEHAPIFLEELKPGLTSDLSGIDVVIPHQPSGLALDFLSHLGHVFSSPIALECLKGT